MKFIFEDFYQSIVNHGVTISSRPSLSYILWWVIAAILTDGYLKSTGFDYRHIAVGESSSKKFRISIKGKVHHSKCIGNTETNDHSITDERKDEGSPYI
ncbi:MAG: hypothetical protein M0Z45_01855 [Actinomycetota bacterium]|nr:hypothetical protein [Actinomycetota bacterium]